MSERLELDERLRRAARTYRRLGNHTAEGMFLEAADTICELQTENAKLRDGANAMRQLYEDELKHALADNDKLREQLAKARDPQRIGGTADPESFVYAIEQLREFRWQHATNDEEAIPYINNVADAHERENAKLRDERDGWKKVCVDQEVMHVMHEEMLDNENAKLRELVSNCHGWLAVNCEKGSVIPRNGLDAIEQSMRELGVEVDEC